MMKAEPDEGNGGEGGFQAVGTAYVNEIVGESPCGHGAVRGQEKCSPSGM